MNLEFAQRIVQCALQQATSNDQSVAVAIVDSHGELISFAKMDECSFQAALLAKNKAYTAARDRQPTSQLGLWAQQTSKDMGYWTDPKITGLGGGLPVESDGRVIGAIGVSGLSEQQDEELAHFAISSLPHQA
ncbi:GlcG/HbpS family heme-binding protein [Vibrio ulleungensis]|uniref:Heme-binding protein n=1 Tax=Vibrio ulleungensis TaxID=2807619 RepID=A0ABS2HLV6_9VIBR|nr:heme-binding protein [Vibrio ulleungensis]MBM7037989.1 heme-binding protein [Vibrio ulleungensis]